jgi:hypothetical protein
MGILKSNNPFGRTPDYGENRTRVNMTLTPTCISALDDMAKALKISRSELVERIGRGIIPLGLPTATTLDPREHCSDDPLTV